MTVKIPLGNIVLVRQVPDKQGGNHKDRFVVLIRDYNDGDTHIVAVTVSVDAEPRGRRFSLLPGQA